MLHAAGSTRVAAAAAAADVTDMMSTVDVAYVRLLQPVHWGTSNKGTPTMRALQCGVETNMGTICGDHE